MVTVFGAAVGKLGPSEWQPAAARGETSATRNRFAMRPSPGCVRLYAGRARRRDRVAARLVLRAAADREGPVPARAGPAVERAARFAPGEAALPRLAVGADLSHRQGRARPAGARRSFARSAATRADPG